MNNDLLITELKYECKDFADKLMKMFGNKVVIEFNVFDPEEMRKDTMKDEVTIEEQAEAENVTEETIREYRLKSGVKRLKEMGYKITKEEEMYKDTKKEKEWNK